MSTQDDLTPEQLQILIQVYARTHGDTSGTRTVDIQELLENQGEDRLAAVKALGALMGDLGLLEQATTPERVYVSEAGKQWAFRWLQRQYDPEPN